MRSDQVAARRVLAEMEQVVRLNRGAHGDVVDRWAKLLRGELRQRPNLDQLTIPDLVLPPAPLVPRVDPDFDGETYDPALDHERLTRQLGRVWAVLNRGGWWTLEQLGAAVRAPEASVSARLRDLRKPKFGGYQIERERGESGQWRYRMVRKP